MPCGSKTQSYKLCKCTYKSRCRCLIPREKKPPPPFNIGRERDVIIGMHPKYYIGLGSPDSPIVGTYNPVPAKCEPPPTNWDREIETAEFSATMGGRLAGTYGFERNLLKTGRGPGTHEILQWPENVLGKPCKSIRRDVGFGTCPLFKPAFESTTPGPGHTRKNPYHYIDKRRREGSSCLPTFEYDGLQPRFQRSFRSWSLPCNLYDVKHPDSLEASLRKVTGKRGPYDLFTGPRDDSTLTGYQASAKLEDRGDWPKSLPSELDRLLRKSNYFKGRWTTCPRFPKISGDRMMLQDLALSYKDPSHPGPGHYNPREPRKPRNAKNYPFDSNVENVRPYPSSEIRPGPARYKIREWRRIKGNGWTFVFKSKTPRTDFIFIPTYNAF